MSKFSSKLTIEDRVHILSDHVHKPGKVYPTGAGGVTATAGNAAPGTLGSYVEVIPVNIVTPDFDIHYIFIEGASADTTYELVFYASTTEISRLRITILDIANGRILPYYPMMTDLVEPNTQIQVKVMSASGNADTLTFSVGYHCY